MNVQLQKLVSLQEIDFEISEFQKMLKLFPTQIESALAELEAKKKDLNELSALIESLQLAPSSLDAMSLLFNAGR